MVDVPSKPCTRCDTVKPLADFSPNRHMRSGVQSWCRECGAEARRQRRAKFPGVIRQYEKNRRDEDRKGYAATRRAQYALRRDKAVAQKRLYYQANKAKCNAGTKRWYESHREHMAAKARERYASDEATRLRASVRSNIRRARKAGAIANEHVDPRAVAERDRWICHLCKHRVSKRTMSLDHLIPIARGGAHNYANVALAHIGCNKRRGVGRLPAQLRLH